MRGIVCRADRYCFAYIIWRELKFLRDAVALAAAMAMDNRQQHNKVTKSTQNNNETETPCRPVSIYCGGNGAARRHQ